MPMRAPASRAGSAASLQQAAVAPVLHSPRAGSFRRGNRLRTAGLAAAAALAIVAVAVTGALIMPRATETDLAARLLPPSLEHPFGTDRLGRDMLACTLAGLALSTGIGLVAVAASSAIALALGCASAVGGRRADAVVTWIIDFMMGVPHIVLLILISFALGRGYAGVVAGIALTHWPSLARVVRAEVLQVRGAPYVAAAGRLGRGRAAIVARHIVPHVLPQFLVGVVLMFPHAILHEASITFLGFGLPPEAPAIGIILSEAMGYLSSGMWWLAFFPGLALVAVVMLFDACGQALRRLLDPVSAQE